MAFFELFYSIELMNWGDHLEVLMAFSGLELRTEERI